MPTDLDAEPVRTILEQLWRTGMLELPGGSAGAQQPLFGEKQMKRKAGHHERLCKLRLHAAVKNPASIRRILKNRGEPTETPPLSPARGGSGRS